MVETDSEVMSQLREEHQQHEHIIHNESTSSSSLPQPSKNNNHHQIQQSLGRQPSIYSLTLDEFQNTLCDNNVVVGNKNFSSMNMDEFLNSIWTAEEAEAQANNVKPAVGPTHDNHFPPSACGNNKAGISIVQHSLPRQASLAIPEPFCRKTVEEVWSEISKTSHPRQQQQQQRQDRETAHDQGSSRVHQRQPTLGDMTLEDFLVRAGIVRERNYAVSPSPRRQPPAQRIAYGMYQNAAAPPSAGVGVGPAGFVARPMVVVSPNYQQTIQPGINMGDPSSNYSMKRVVGCGGGFGQVMGSSPVSPVSSDGIRGNHHHHQQHLVDGVGNQQAGGGGGGRKRIMDGPVEKVVERRQRRMIKNRESAARSRARKQAYTVELEAELNQLKEENARLRQALVELERRRKQQCYEDARAKAHMQQQAKAYKLKDKLQRMRRCLSAPL